MGEIKRLFQEWKIAREISIHGTLVMDEFHGLRFYIDLIIRDNCIFDRKISTKYRVETDEESLIISVGKLYWMDYHDLVEKIAIWNQVENGNDFCFQVWAQLGAPISEDDLNGYKRDDECDKDEPNYGHVEEDYDYDDEEEDGYEETDEYDDRVTYWSYDSSCYDQIRYFQVSPQLVRIFKEIESYGYIRSYTVRPEKPDARWHYFCKSDGTIDLAVVDKSFLKDKSLMQEIDCLLWTKFDDIGEYEDY